MTWTMSSVNFRVLQCFDSGLDSIGGTGKKVVYWYLAQKRHLIREKVPDNPAEFLEALKGLFGQGAGILERTIVRELKKSFNITLSEGLVEVLALIKQKDQSIPFESANKH